MPKISNSSDHPCFPLASSLFPTIATTEHQQQSSIITSGAPVTGNPAFNQVGDMEADRVVGSTSIPLYLESF
ncbi:hypothetical protein HanIR_Chr10g0454881 [Helianthus annuus]|nr:hypothetical protein HanIR_Chr10g0454881 [Helianthus annuus]